MYKRKKQTDVELSLQTCSSAIVFVIYFLLNHKDLFNIHCYLINFVTYDMLHAETIMSELHLFCDGLKVRDLYSMHCGDMVTVRLKQVRGCGLSKVTPGSLRLPCVLTWA